VMGGGSQVNNVYMAQYYYLPWYRCPPYLIGCLAGFAWLDHKEFINKAFQNSLVVYGSIGVVVIVLMSCTYGIEGQMRSVPTTWNRTSSAFYCSLAKPAWVSAIWLLCALCFTKTGGPIGTVIATVLEHPVLGRISKLTFCMYLVQPNIMSTLWDVQVATIHYSPAMYGCFYITIVVVNLIASFLVHIFIELPMANTCGMALAMILPAQKPKKPKAEPLPEVDGKDNVVIGMDGVSSEGDSLVGQQAKAGNGAATGYGSATYTGKTPKF